MIEFLFVILAGLAIIVWLVMINQSIQMSKVKKKRVKRLNSYAKYHH